MGAQQEMRYEEGVQDGDIGEAERHMADKMAIPLDNIHFSILWGLYMRANWGLGCRMCSRSPNPSLSLSLAESFVWRFYGGKVSR